MCYMEKPGASILLFILKLKMSKTNRAVAKKGLGVERINRDRITQNLSKLHNVKLP